MKAIIINEYGDASQLKETELPTPTPKHNEVLVEIHAVSINAVDWKIRAGYMKEKLSYDFPLVLGLDMAGVVMQTGGGVTHFKTGDAVLAKTNISKNGAYAEFVAIDEKLLVLKPENLSFEEAAALPLSGMTAWQALTDFSNLKSGETILIQGGSGGVGSLAIQFAKAIGATVVATASGKNTEFVQRLGADRVIAYDKEDFVSVLGQSIDVVFDMIGGDVLTRSYEVLVKGGRLVTIWGNPDKELDKKFGVTSTTFVTLEGGNHLSEIVKMAEDGKVKPVIGATFPLNADGLQRAHKQSETGHARGKLIVKVK